MQAPAHLQVLVCLAAATGGRLGMVRLVAQGWLRAGAVPMDSLRRACRLPGRDMVAA